MSKVLVSIVSKETIPNIEFIKEKKSEVTEYLFLTTDSMKDRLEWILNVTMISSELITTINVNPYSPDDVEKKLEKNIDDKKTFIVNVTCGTKIMSLAVYDFFKKVDSSIFYLTGKGGYTQLYPGLQTITRKLNADLSLEEYLSAYGFKTMHKSDLIGSFNSTSQILEYFLNQYDKDNDDIILNKFRANRSSSLKVNSEIDNFLDKINFSPSDSDKLSKYENRFLSGEWLEEYIYHFIRKEFPSVSEIEIGLGWHVMKSGGQNEFDVLLIQNNKLYLFECKTSIYRDTEKSRTFIGETIYKSDSLRNKFGLYAQTIIVTLSDLSNPRLETHIERANASRVQLIGKEDFSSQQSLKTAIDKI